MTRARLCLTAVVIVSLLAVHACERRSGSDKKSPVAHGGAPSDAGVADAPPPPVPDAALPPPPIETWDVGEGKKKNVWVRARDVDPGWLLWELDPPERTLRRHQPAEPISGTADAPRDAIVAFLRARHGRGDPSASGRRRLRGRGRKVDLFFYGAPVHDLMRLLAAVGGINLAMVPDDDLRVDVAYKGVPWDGLLDAVVAVSGLKVHRPHKQLYLVTSGDPPARDRQFGEERIDLAAGRVPLGPLVGLLEWTSGAAMTAPCTSEVQAAAARRASMADLAQMLAIWSGQEILPLPNACPVPETIGPSAVESGDWKLVAIARSARSSGLMRQGSRYALLPEGDQVVLQLGYARVNGTDYPIDWGRADPSEPEAIDELQIRAWIVGEKAVKVLGFVDDLATVIGERWIGPWRREGESLVVDVEGETRRLVLP